MSFVVVFFILVSLLCGVSFGSEQQVALPRDFILQNGVCELWAGDPPECSLVLSGKMVWTFPVVGVYQPYFVDIIRKPQPPTNQTILDPLYAMPLNCSTYYLRLFCPTVFMICSTTSYDEPTAYPAIPHPVDHQVCLDANDACGYFLTSNGQALINCSMPNPQFTDLPQWPETGFIFGPQNISAEKLPVSELGSLELDCPAPLIWVAPEADALTGSPCAFTCLNFSAMLLPNVTTYEEGWTGFMVMAWLSWLGGLYVFVTHIVFPDLWQFPHRLITPMAFGILCMFTPVLANSGAGIGNHNKYLCDTWLVLSQYSSESIWASWSLHFGVWIVANYWLTQSLTLFVTVVLKYDVKEHIRLEIAFHIFAWVFAAIFSFIPLGLHYGGNALLDPFPFLSFQAPKWAFWVFWNAWLFLYMVQEALTTGSSIVVLILSKCKPHGHLTTIDQWRLCFFALFFYQTALAGLSVILWQEVADLHSQSETYIKCLLLSRSYGHTNDICVPPQIPLGLYWWSLITLGITGIELFVFFGLMHPRVRTAWFVGVQNLINGKSFFYYEETTPPEEELEEPQKDEKEAQETNLMND
jgi:hypothetical protein